jgi:hypothetical protein
MRPMKLVCVLAGALTMLSGCQHDRLVVSKDQTPLLVSRAYVEPKCPSAMSRDEFVQRFGSLSENEKKIAQLTRDRDLAELILNQKLRELTLASARLKELRDRQLAESSIDRPRNYSDAYLEQLADEVKTAEWVKSIQDAESIAAKSAYDEAERLRKEALPKPPPGQPQPFAAPLVLGFGAAILEAILPALVDIPLDLLSSALHEAAKEKVDISAARTSIYLHSIGGVQNRIVEPRLAANPAVGCVVFVRGLIGDQDSSKNPIDDGGLAIGAAQFLNTKGFWRSVNRGTVSPEFYLEVRIELSAELSAFRAVPVYALANELLRGGGSPEINFKLALSSLTGNKDATPVALAVQALPRLELGQPRNEESLAGYASSWIAYPSPDAAARAKLSEYAGLFEGVDQARKSRIAWAEFVGCRERLPTLELSAAEPNGAQNRKLQGCLSQRSSIMRAAMSAAGTSKEKDAKSTGQAAHAAQAALSDWIVGLTLAKERSADLLRRQRLYFDAMLSPPDITPITVDFEVIENRKGSPFLKAVADALDRSKKGIGDALVSELSPAERAKRRADEDQQARTNRAAVASAQDNVRLKQAELDDLPATATRAERVRAENALRQAKIAANNAYLADGRGVPYPEAQP